MDSTKRPKKKRSRDDLLLEIKEMKSIMRKYCSTSSTLEDTDADADDTVNIHNDLMDLKKNTEDLKSMSKDLVGKQRRAYNEITQALERMTQIAMKYSSRNQASFSDEDFEHALELAEEQKAEIEELKREKKDLEVEFEQLKEIVDRSMSHGGSSRNSSTTCAYQRRCKSSASKNGDASKKVGCYKEFKKIIDNLKQKLQEKEDELEDMEALSQTLIAKERSLNDELQEARKELIRGFGDECNRSILIGIKRMGELDPRTFDSVFPKNDGGKGCSREDDVEIAKSVQLCSFWESNLKDQSRHPFKIIEVQGTHKEVIGEDDELLNSVKDVFGEEVYKAISTAAMELNEYNPSGREPVQEIWNIKERREQLRKRPLVLC